MDQDLIVLLMGCLSVVGFGGVGWLLERAHARNERLDDRIKDLDRELCLLRLTYRGKPLDAEQQARLAELDARADEWDRRLSA